MKRKGFTLIEVLVVTGIVALISAATLGLMVSTKYSADLSDAQIQTKTCAQRALDKIASEVRLSQPAKIRITDSVGWTAENANSTGSVINFQIPVGVYSTDFDLTGSYGLKWGCANPPPGENVEGHYLAYSVDPVNNHLVRSDYANADGSGANTKIIAPYISLVSFSRTDTSSSLINISVTASMPSPFKPNIVTQTVSSNIRLRNF